MDVDRQGGQPDVEKAIEGSAQPPIQLEVMAPLQQEDRSTTDRSFHSAREEVTKTGILDIVPASEVEEPEEQAPAQSPEQQALESTSPANSRKMDEPESNEAVLDQSPSLSSESSPAQQLVRKSSLTFAALPPRPTLPTEKSLGMRTSQAAQAEQERTNVQQSSFFGRITGNKSVGGPQIQQEDGRHADISSTMEKAPAPQEEPDSDTKAARLHNKSSTQRLHDKISLLGQSHPHRPTKSIPSAPQVSAQSAAQTRAAQADTRSYNGHEKLSANMASTNGKAQNDEEEDWIQPPKFLAASSKESLASDLPPGDTGDDIEYKEAPSNQAVPFQRSHITANKVSSPLPQSTRYSTDEDEDENWRVVSDSRTASPGIFSSYNGIRTFDDEERPKDFDGGSTTPIGSPSAQRHADGPLSASKSKLQSIMKTARGLFSSSAGVSAQAKMESLTADLNARGPSEVLTADGETAGSSVNESAGVTEKGVSKAQLIKRRPINTSAPKTRSSAEREKRERQQQNECWHPDQAEISVDNEGIQHAKLLQDPTKPTRVAGNPTNFASKPVRQSPRKTQDPALNDNTTQASETSHISGSTVSQAPTRPGQSQRSKDPRRPVRPTKDAAAKPRPQPVAIRVGVPSAQNRAPLSNSILSSTLAESLPPNNPRQPAAAKKPSLQTSASNSNLKSSVSSTSTKPRALIAAEKKKEMVSMRESRRKNVELTMAKDDRENQRKLEQKREIERRRAAQHEETKRQEQMQRQEAEKQRERERLAIAEETKKTAQRAMEKKRLDLKKEQAKAPQRPVEMVSTLCPQIGRYLQLRPEQLNANSRPELGGSRPPSRQHTVQEIIRPVNNAKHGIKRVLEPEADVQVPAMRQQGPPTNLANQNKRRKTEEEEPEEFPMRPTHAPPIRQSGTGKNGTKSSIFGNNYSVAPPPAAHHYNVPSMPKPTISNQAYQQHPHQAQLMRPVNHPDMRPYANGKIPFAEHPNPPSQNQYHPKQQPAVQPTAQLPFKTPYSKMPAPTQNAKPFSPQYQNGENIQLEDIPTDSEEDDSDSDADNKAKPANLPEWAQSPHLRQLLESQDERMDADAVFGPVPSPHIEEMFKERHHRFRSRTSSANWAGADRLTEEEIRRDVAARQQLRRDGGWTFGL